MCVTRPHCVHPGVTMYPSSESKWPVGTLYFEMCYSLKFAQICRPLWNYVTWQQCITRLFARPFCSCHFQCYLTISYLLYTKSLYDYPLTNPQRRFKSVSSFPPSSPRGTLLWTCWRHGWARHGPSFDPSYEHRLAGHDGNTHWLMESRRNFF